MMLPRVIVDLIQDFGRSRTNFELHYELVHLILENRDPIEYHSHFLFEKPEKDTTICQKIVNCFELDKKEQTFVNGINGFLSMCEKYLCFIKEYHLFELLRIFKTNTIIYFVLTEEFGM